MTLTSLAMLVLLQASAVHPTAAQWGEHLLVADGDGLLAIVASLVLRGRAILMLSAGHGPATVARFVGLSERNVRKWRSRWEGCHASKPSTTFLVRDDRRASRSPHDARS